MIKQISVMEPEFKKYGKVIGGYDLKENFTENGRNSMPG